jgi:hypothetical protein
MKWNQSSRQQCAGVFHFASLQAIIVVKLSAIRAANSPKAVSKGLNVQAMKFTKYFLYTRERPDRKVIEMNWIERAVHQPDAERIQSDGRIRRWKRIPEAQGRVLRVVLLEDGETVHNAFFDRGFEEERK